MNYVQFHLGDWLAGTALLSPTERGVYMDLLVRYYKEERPIKQEECKRIARAYAPYEQEAMQYVLQTFFTLDDEGYHHSRCDEEIAKAREVSEKRKKSANARWAKQTETTSAKNVRPVESERNATAMQVHSKSNANGLLTINQQPLTINQEEVIATRPKATRPSTPKAKKPECVTDQVWSEWQSLKKKLCKSCTQRMVDALVREASKAGMSAEEAMVYQLEKGWKGFEAEWVKNDQQRTSRPTDPQYGIGVCQPIPEEEVHWLTDEERAESRRQMEAEGYAPF